MDEEKRRCPRCETELTCDEVDIGVGIMRGNYRCDCCGWSERDEAEIRKILADKLFYGHSIPIAPLNESTDG